MEKVNLIMIEFKRYVWKIVRKCLLSNYVVQNIKKIMKDENTN